MNTLSFLKPATVLKDFVKLSIQTSEYHYCSPRENNCPYYDLVEVGFIEKEGKRYPAPESWIPFAEEGHVLSDVFAYIPIELVNAFIAEHGGKIATVSNSP